MGGRITKGKAITIPARASKLWKLENQIKNAVANAGPHLNVKYSGKSGLLYYENNSEFKLKQVEKRNIPNSMTGGRHLEIEDEKNLSSENILHKLASYTTLFTLSGLSEEELQDHSFVENTVHDVVARSGGIGYPNVSSSPFAATEQKGFYKDTIVKNEQETFKKLFSHSIDVLAKGRDIFFESVNLISTVGPSEERSLADFVKMEFKLHEPYGISFIEKMKAATILNGYEDHMDAPMLLTIEFKGFNENGIPIKDGGTVRKIPVLITRVEFDVNEGGAIYDVIAVRINDIAFDDRFKFPRTEIIIQASILSNGKDGAVEQLAMKLNEAIKKEIGEGVRTLADEYRIEVDDEVARRSQNYVSPNKSTHTATANSGGKSKSSWLDTLPTDFSLTDKQKKQMRDKIEGTLNLKVLDTQIDSLVSITKLIEDLVRSTRGYESIATKFWITYLRKSGIDINENEEDTDVIRDKVKDFIKSGRFEKELGKDPFVDWFKIKTSVETKYNEGLDEVNKMHKKIITYKVIPYKIHVLKFIKPGVYMNSKDLAKQVYRSYNYLYTGANHDIQNLRINYKAAYYQRNTIPLRKLDKGGWKKIIGGIVSRVIGNQDENVTNNDTAMLRSYPSVLVRRNTVDTEGQDNEGTEAMKQDFYDVLTNPVADMMRIEMEILGDPAYICQDQFIPLDRDGNQYNKSKEKFDNTFGCFNADNYTPLIELIYALPDDINEKTGLMFESKGKIEENLFFAGIYQVVKIESRIDSGQFTQNLTCVRLNNQQGEGLNPNFTEAGKFAKNAVNKKDNNNIVGKVKTKIDKLASELGHESKLTKKQIIKKSDEIMEEVYKQRFP